MEHIANLFEGCSISRFKIALLFKEKRSCTIHSGIFINDNNECEFEWLKFYCDNMHDTHNEVTDEDITPFERMSVQLFLKFIMEN